MIMAVVFFIAFLTIPFQICFVVMDYEKIYLDNVNLLVYALCWIDIILQCITGFYNKDKDEITLEQGPILM